MNDPGELDTMNIGADGGRGPQSSQTTVDHVPTKVDSIIDNSSSFEGTAGISRGEAPAPTDEGERSSIDTERHAPTFSPVSSHTSLLNRKVVEETQKEAPQLRSAGDADLPNTIFSQTEIIRVVEWICKQISTESTIPLDQLPRSLDRITQDVAIHGKSIGTALKAKLDYCLQILHSPPRVDWRPTRKSIAERSPLIFVDALVDLIGFVSATKGVWNIPAEELAQLLARVDQISLLASEAHRRLFIAEKAKAKSQTTTAAPSQGSDPNNNGLSLCTIFDAAARLTPCIVSLLHGSLHIASSRLVKAQPLDPVIAVLTSSQLTTGLPSNIPSPTAAQKASAASVAQALESCPDDVGPFIRTVDVFQKAEICQRLFLSSEMRVAVCSMTIIQAALQELSIHRASEWKSYLEQRSLPRHSVEVPSELLLKSFGKSASFSVEVDVSRQSTDVVYRKVESNGRRCFQGHSAGARGVQTLIQTKLEELATAIRSLYRSAASVLDGSVYEDSSVIAELTDATVIGVYVPAVAFLFYNDFIALTRWLSPLLPEIRRKIRQQTAAVNSSSPSTTIASLPAVPATTALNPPPAPSAASNQTKPDISVDVKGRTSPLTSLLQQLDSICLSRAAESTALLHLFLPHMKKSIGGGNPIVAPADKINRILVYLAWEGGLMTAYQQLYGNGLSGSALMQGTGAKTPSPSTPSTMPGSTATPCLPLSMTAARQCNLISRSDSDGKGPRCAVACSSAGETSVISSAQIEDAVVNCIVEGCRTFKEKFGHALDLFDDNDVTTSRGEQVLEICQRILEAISLRYLGEMEMRQGKEMTSATKNLASGSRSKPCLLSNLARLTMPSRATQVSTKIVEALPKLFGEYLHQAVFYSPPFAVEETSSDASSATSIAAVARLSGVASDLDSKLLSTLKLAESSMVNTHANYNSIVELDSRLTDLSSSCQSQTEGVIDRHTHQLRTHTDSLAAHKKDLGRMDCLLNSHQTRIENHSADLRKLSDLMSANEVAMKQAAENANQQMTKSLALSTATADAKLADVAKSFEKSLLELNKELADMRAGLEEKRHHIATLEESGVVLRNKIDELAESHEQRMQPMERQLEIIGLSQFEKRLETLEARAKDIDLLKEAVESTEEENKVLRLSVATIQETMKEWARTLNDSLVIRAKQELSAYLTETLSQCVSNHITYHLDKRKQDQQQSVSHRRMLRWTGGHGHQQATPTPRRTTSPPAFESNGNDNGRSAYSKGSESSIYRTGNSQIKVTKSRQPALINSTHRPLPGHSNDSLTSMADTSSVLEENSNMEIPPSSVSIFSDIPLLDLPDPRAAASSSFVSDGRSVFHDRVSAQASNISSTNLTTLGLETPYGNAEVEFPELGCQPTSARSSRPSSPNGGFLLPSKGLGARRPGSPLGSRILPGGIDDTVSPDVTKCTLLRCSANVGVPTRHHKP